MTRAQVVQALAAGLFLGAGLWGGCGGGSSSQDCAPVSELCNGVDDDCDGQTDEEFAVGDPCALGVGACQASGVLGCAGNGLGVSCDAIAGTPGVETCNLTDDDCDGRLDEELAGCCEPGTEQPCGIDQGACTAGTETCSGAGMWGTCLSGGVAVVLPGDLTELCNGVDDSCDGQTDEALVGAACPNQQGICAGSRLACDGAAGWKTSCGASDYATSYQVEETSCDDLDNDCDGQTDEMKIAAYRDRDGDAYGVVFETSLVCPDASGWATIAGDCNDDKRSIHPDALETCNSTDDDCDGQTDEGFILGASCTAGEGVCTSLGRVQCKLDGTGTECGAVAGLPGTEQCGDSLDNDCDTATDEGCPPS